MIAIGRQLFPGPQWPPSVATVKWGEVLPYLRYDYCTDILEKMEPMGYAVKAVTGGENW